MSSLRRLVDWWTRVRPAAVPPSPPPPPAAPAPALTPTPAAGPPPRKVTLRAERSGTDYRHLEAYVDAAGVLHIDGQDLGPGTSIVSDDGEYEWFETIAAADVPRLIATPRRPAGRQRPPPART